MKTRKENIAEQRELVKLITRQIGTDDPQGLYEIAQWTRELASLASDLADDRVEDA